ncbi:raffinose/stachyose/melibiose transport system permease protein [Paenibacillus sp. 1_12]|uniref:carbohydrate ABC transporter permease n=1 Tax=Paenibacillus sp. 1_12 TaxID=1566278 RepID=UPI0008E54140|nr:carbohydrate ABC transporter permease [Paenibacillus sp. 1_12]SFK79071.1 raffinose/stachyose/melibiose transport system permease protein [Paenibacillus sp. 1_12]
MISDSSSKLKYQTVNTSRYMLLLLYAVVTIFPLLWTLSNSFRTNDQIFSKFAVIPESLTYFKNYEMIFATSIPLAFYNSLTITALSLLIMLVCAIPASYLLSQYKFRFAQTIYLFFVIGIIVPRLSILIAEFKNFQMFGFLGKQYPIALCYATFELSIALFLLVGFMQSIPPSIIESAKIDGANSFDVLIRIVMPVSRNGIVTVIILAFVSIWNEYAYAMVMIPNIKFRTLTILLASAKNEFFVEYGMMSAGVVVAVVPMIIVYGFLQDKIISGMVAGAVKG